MTNEKEEEKASTPLSSIDRWLLTCDVQKTINSLLFDLVAASPKDVIGFIHHWSASRLPRENVTTTKSTSFAKEKEQSRSFESLSNSVLESDTVINEEMDNNNVTVSFESDCKPTVELLRSIYADAQNSPFEFLIDSNQWEEKVRCKRKPSLSDNSIGVCISRGNYGFVVPAVLKKTNNNNNNNNNNNRFGTMHNGKNCFSDGLLNCGDKTTCSSFINNFTADMLSAGKKSPIMVAIKISPVQALWSLDEANYLMLITARRWLLENEVQRLKERLETLRCLDNCFAEQAHGRSDVVEEKKTRIIYEKKYLPIYQCEKLEKEVVEARFIMLNTLLQGARLVTSLVGDVMYDAQKDVLLFPLTFYPSTLRSCIENRIKHCGESVSSECPLPNFFVGDSGNTVLAALFSLQEIKHVARSLCYALHFLHTLCGICHLDVKVDNILLSTPWVLPSATRPATCAGGADTPPCDEASFPQVVLGDFGLAQPLGSPIMQFGDYQTMAPEVYWAHASSDAAHTAYRTAVFCASSDIWSVGCVLLQMINGLEYGAWKPSDMFDALEENHVSPALRHPEVWPMELNDFITRCFERDPRRRMQPVDALRHPFLAPK